MEKLPLVLINTFLVNTAKSYKKFYTVSTYHDAALLARSGSAPFDTLYNFYHPFHEAFVTEYNEWLSASETQQGSTQVVTDMLKDLSANLIEIWDIKIQNVYLKKTPQYKALLPNGRNPFQTGTQDQRIAAVNALILNIGADAALATLKAEIVTFKNALTTAQTTKLGKFTLTETESEEVEAARIAGAEAMWKDLMELGSHFYQTPALAAPYFDWETLHPGQQTHFILTLLPMQHKTIVKRTLAAEQRVEVTNTGQVEIQLYCSHKPDEDNGETGVTLAPGESGEFDAVQLGNSAENPYINARNTDAGEDGHLEMEIK